MNKIHKETKKSKAVNEVKKPLKYQRPERHIKRVDFQKIEEAPQNKFEREIQAKIAVKPEALDSLIEKEEREMLLEAAQKVHFSRPERLLIEGMLKGIGPLDIARKLDMSNSSAHEHIRRAKAKILFYLKRYGIGKDEV